MDQELHLHGAGSIVTWQKASKPPVKCRTDAKALPVPAGKIPPRLLKPQTSPKIQARLRAPGFSVTLLGHPTAATCVCLHKTPASALGPLLCCSFLRECFLLANSLPPFKHLSKWHLLSEAHPDHAVKYGHSPCSPPPPPHLRFLTQAHFSFST